MGISPPQGWASETLNHQSPIVNIQFDVGFSGLGLEPQKGGRATMDPVRMPIEDVIDLHTFNPKEVPDLLEEYFIACIDADIFSLRVIHGKGTGTLKKRVQGALKRSLLVSSYRDAPIDAGGWGATLVELKRQVTAEPVTGR